MASKASGARCLTAHVPCISGCAFDDTLIQRCVRVRGPLSLPACALLGHTSVHEEMKTPVLALVSLTRVLWGANHLSTQCCMQASQACLDEPECMFFSMDGWPQGDTAEQFAKWPGVAQASVHLGYVQSEHLLTDATMYLELVPMLSRFCLCPPGDTPKRRAFIDAILAGCAVC